MTIFTLTEGENTLTLSRDNGFIVRPFKVLPGGPRRVARPVSGGNGERNDTALTNAGTVTFQLRLPPHASSFWAREQMVRVFTRPQLRPTITIDWEDGTSPVVQAELAEGVVDGTIDRPTHRDLQVQFVIPSGRIESAELHLQPILPGTPVGGLAIPTAGLAIPTAGLALTSPGVPGFGVVVNAGAADAPAILRLHGPFGDASSDETVIAHAESGGQIVFSNLQVAADDYVEVDLDTHRITLNGMSSQSRRSFLDSSQTRWFWLAPGDNRISFLPETFASPAQLEVLWRDSY